MAKNLVTGGAGNDTYILKAVDSQVIIDNKTDRVSTDNDKLEIDTSTSGKTLTELLDSEVKYDPGNDILKCRNFYVVGFSKLSKVLDSSGTFSYDVSSYLMPILNYKISDNPAKYKGDFSSVLTDMNTIRNSWS